MSADTTAPGGFAGDPAAALQVTGSGACCGSPAQPVGGILPSTGDTGPADSCRGTARAARTSDSCCGTGARADAVASGRGCCG
ncbi:hypothetical protein GA0070606_5649 [Micromonospora citrea]|uniref:Uncharacterized protein n=1 Tax=Micromonospora citrea TaxID=47855 RepID=A0A1C6VYC7_9ACTN|nr:hypothetical protein [Micromonospora citrea]SCL71207.1 hypothetical protein GA0070606_5649 [Micromonospora citrea]